MSLVNLGFWQNRVQLMYYLQITTTCNKPGELGQTKHITMAWNRFLCSTGCISASWKLQKIVLLWIIEIEIRIEMCVTVHCPIFITHLDWQLPSGEFVDLWNWFHSLIVLRPKEIPCLSPVYNSYSYLKFLSSHMVGRSSWRQWIGGWWQIKTW